MGEIKNGFDTSKWQGSKVNYKLAKEAGMEFVILRIGYNKTLDTCFEKDYFSALAAGLKVGVYFYTLATTEAEAMADASRVLGWLNTRQLDFPIAYDMEDKQKKLTGVINSKIYNAFAAKIKEDGRYTTMLYTYENFFLTHIYAPTITDPLWIAKYSSKPEIGRIISMWQYSSNAVNTSFYKGKLDVNYLLVDNLCGSSDTKINTVSLNPYTVPSRTIKLTLPRQKGDDVKWVQWELAQKGYLEEDGIDGIWGKGSDAALKTYQKFYSLLVDGKCGSATRYCMLND